MNAGGSAKERLIFGVMAAGAAIAGARQAAWVFSCLFSGSFVRRDLVFPTLIAAPDLYALYMVRESGIRCGRVPNMVKNRAGSDVIAERKNYKKITEDYKI